MAKKGRICRGSDHSPKWQKVPNLTAACHDNEHKLAYKCEARTGGHVTRSIPTCEPLAGRGTTISNGIYHRDNPEGSPQVYNRQCVDAERELSQNEGRDDVPVVFAFLLQGAFEQ